MGTAGHNSGERGFGPYEYALGDELRGERATLGKTLLDVQRDLRIKAAYIAAIEDAKPAVFPNPSFVPGYVRSYARYLRLDPDEIFRASARRAASSAPGRPAQAEAGRRPRRRRRCRAASVAIPAGEVPRGLPVVPFSAIGSLLVLVLWWAGSATAAGRSWRTSSGCSSRPSTTCRWRWPRWTRWTPPDRPRRGAGAERAGQPGGGHRAGRLYRQQEAEVPILVPRDGPIAALDPDRRPALLARDGADGGEAHGGRRGVLAR